MKIEVRNLKIAAFLSQETTAYAADVYVNGAKTFAASNEGHGGCDMIHPYPGAAVTEAEVSAWLADNCPPDGPYEADPAKRAPYDTGTVCNLETFIGRAIDRADAAKESAKIRRLYEKKLATRICSLRGDDFLLHGMAIHTPTPERLAQVRAKCPDAVLLNDADEATKERGLRAFCPNFSDGAETDEALTEAVYERLREQCLTVADAKWLLAQDRKAEKPDADFQAMLSGVIEAGEKAYADYCAERDAAHVQRVG